MTSRKQRRQLILDLVARNEIQNQQQLQDLLSAEGVAATQATISRDLQDLGVSKGASGYVRVDRRMTRPEGAKELRERLKSETESIERAGTMVVIRTPFALAKPLAREIESAKLPQIVGVIAGDETMFLATRSASQAAELKRLLKKLRE